MAFNSSLRSGRKRAFKSEINVVPYIDVMLVLLIIFMAVPANEAPSVVNLPSAEKSALPPDTYIRLSVQPDNKLSIGPHRPARTPARPAPGISGLPGPDRRRPRQQIRRRDPADFRSEEDGHQPGGIGHQVTCLQ